MIETIKEIAPLIVWAQTGVAAVLLLAGFVAYGHYRVRKDGYGESFGRLTGAGALDSSVRWAVILLSLGIAFWLLAIGWSGFLVGLCVGLAGTALAIDFGVMIGRTVDAFGRKKRERTGP